MKEPWRTMFQGFDEHPILGPHLQGDEPYWAGIANDERIKWLSTGETVLVDFAAALANVRTYLDPHLQMQVEVALLNWLTGVAP